jgi:hypothetical protein
MPATPVPAASEVKKIFEFQVIKRKMLTFIEKKKLGLSF